MRVLGLIVAFALLFMTGPASAQAPSAAASVAPPANPHGGMQNPHGQNPHGAGDPHAQVQDRSDDAPDLPAGTLDVTIANADDQALVGADVELEILSQKISEGEQRSTKRAKTDAEGRALFTGLSTANFMSYQVVVKAAPAEFASPQIRLRDTMGHRVLVHVFPPTSDINRTIVMGAFLSVETRDDVFQCDMVVHVFNVSRMAFIPESVVFSLPEGYKAFSGEEAMFDSRVEDLEGRGGVLKGTYPPGERKVRFRFQLPKPTESEVTFTVGMPARVAQAQVVAAASPQMNLEVAGGFPTPEVSTAQSGDRVLVTMRMIKRGEEPIRSLTVTLTGLRVPGPGRWVAVFIALAFAGLGVFAARGDLSLASSEKVEGDRERARELILQELVAIERAKAAGKLGPNAYERAHRALVDALTRIGIPEEKKPAKKRKLAKA